MAVKSIDVGSFVTLQTSDFASKYGVRKGDLLYIAGDGVVSVKKEDPYELRRILICAKVDKGGHVQIDEGITIDGLKLKAVTKPRQLRLEAIKRLDFEGDSDESTD